MAHLILILVQSQQHMQEFLMEEWQGMEYGLLRERGLWGPPVGSELDKWMLSPTEGPHRMRKKMVRNTQFYAHYPYRPPDSELVSYCLSPRLLVFFQKLHVVYLMCSAPASTKWLLAMTASSTMSDIAPRVWWQMTQGHSLISVSAPRMVLKLMTILS